MKFTWNHERRFNDYSTYIRQTFAQRVQKISIDAGFDCPNRDGYLSKGGCTYCNNETFSPDYCRPEKSVKQQLEEGIAFFAVKYKAQKYFAYFQAYTNTYTTVEKMNKLVSEALSVDKVIGLVIATRPDCIDDEKFKLLQNYAKERYLMLEFGVESTLDKSLLRINRGHLFEATKTAIENAYLHGITTGVHLILGLPGETIDEILQHATTISELPIRTLKLHQLQIIKGTQIAKEFEKNRTDFITFTADEYVDLVIDFLELLSPEIIVERFISESPKDMLISPRWNGLKNFQIVAKIDKQLKARNTWQGRLYRYNSII